MIGGPIRQVTFNGGIYAVAADAEANRVLGGMENEVEANGDGTVRVLQTIVPWRVGGLSLSLNDREATQERLQEALDTGELYPITITYASGVVYEGRGTIVGSLEGSSKTTTVPVTFAGEDRLVRQ